MSLERAPERIVTRLLTLKKIRIIFQIKVEAVLVSNRQQPDGISRIVRRCVMGRLDRTATNQSAKPDVPRDDADFLDPLDEEVGDASEVEDLLQAMHHEAAQLQGKKASRRRLEDRLEDMRLQHQIRDFDFKI